MATPTHPDPPTDDYLDYDALTSTTFSPHAFANTLIHSTNNPSDSPLDLSTPLSRVLFDIQDLDLRLDGLTSSSSSLLLQHTRADVAAGSAVLDALEGHTAALRGGYERLEREVTHRHAAAEETRLVALHIWDAVRVGREVSRVLVLGRTLEVQIGEMGSKGAGTRDDHRAMVRAATTLLGVRAILRAGVGIEPGRTLEDVAVVAALVAGVIDPAERAVVARAEQVVAQFGLSNLTAQEQGGGGAQGQTVAQMESTRSGATSALLALYLLSPVGSSTEAGAEAEFVPALLTTTLQDYLRRAITSSLTSLSAALAALPKLDRTLTEVAARCQNIVALEALLQATPAPQHPLLLSTASSRTLLAPLLASLDTASLPSYFWRSLASSLSSRVQKIVRDGGVSARMLRSQRERVAAGVRGCVARGCVLPGGITGGGGEVKVGGWEREAGVMVGAVVGGLGR